MQARLDGLEKRASGVLVLRGQAGIGKTTLLREVVQRAVGLEMQVAQGLGIQSEMEFDFAGLHQLLLPFAGVWSTCPARSAPRSRRSSGWRPARRRTGSWWARRH